MARRLHFLLPMPAAKPRKAPKKTTSKAVAAALPAKALEGDFPDIDLPVRPPFAPMEAESEGKIPTGEGWLYEPKWDGFRCLAFVRGEQVLLQSKAGQPLGRYFPELVEALAKLPMKTFVVDGEIVIPIGEARGSLSFDDLLLRIHPAESRIRKLAKETPASLYVFDLLVDDRGKSLVELPLEDRRERLEKLFGKVPEGGQMVLSPATPEKKVAERWIGGEGLDGVVAKRLDSPYLSGERGGMVKVKRMRTADCVVGGFRFAQKGDQVGSLLLGLYNDSGQLDHVGFSSTFSAEEKKELQAVLEPHRGGTGFTGKAPGGPSRWSQGRSTEWVPLHPVLVCEVRYDHFSGGRFRHGTKFLRWRPEKKPRECTFDQVRGPHPRPLSRLPDPLPGRGAPPPAPRKKTSQK